MKTDRPQPGLRWRSGFQIQTRIAEKGFVILKSAIFSYTLGHCEEASGYYRTKVDSRCLAEQPYSFPQFSWLYPYPLCLFKRLKRSPSALAKEAALTTISDAAFAGWSAAMSKG
jgi:hypothetical protein